jgi:hypothetical protein
MRDRAQTDANAIISAVVGYRQDLGDCPLEVLDLVVEGYLDDAPGVDPWGGDYVLECSDSVNAVRSPGPDGSLETDDDVVVSEPTR